MAAAKNHYYVLVLTSAGPKFVTKLDYSTKYAEYDKLGKPLEMSKMQAEDIALGLNLNFITAFPITVKWEIGMQPYYYNKGHFEWVDDETEDK